MFTVPAIDGDSPRRRVFSRASTLFASTILGLLTMLMSSMPIVARAQETGASSFTKIWTVPAEATVNAEQCADDSTITVGWSLNTAPASDQFIRVTTNSSQDCAAAQNVEEVEESPALTSEDTTAVGAASLVQDCAGIEGENRFICVRLFPISGSETGIASLIAVWVDTVAPEPPDQVSARSADAALRVEWSWTDGPPSDLASVTAFYRPADGDGETGERSVAGTATSVRIEGLDNDIAYEVWLQPVDEVGNVGEESESVLATPQETAGFWDLYREMGGAEAGGCSGAGVGGSALFAFSLVGLLGLVFMLRTRRQRRPSLVAPVLLFALAALAWPGQSDARVRSERVGEWFIELDFGPYLPEVDSEFDGEGPYQTIFGNRSRVMGRLRAERALWQGIGQLSLGTSIGYSRATGEALFADGTPSADPSTFAWLPLALSLTYRFDHTVRQWGVPLVPYGRVGLSLTPWWISGPDGIAVDSAGNNAIGARAGWFYGGGFKFLLDFIDPRLATDFRRSAGIERTYLYVDFTRMEVTGFGSEGFNLSDTTWFVGLSFEI